jgi:acetyl esterase/lipase
MYAEVGRHFAHRGVGAVLVNYRLPPDVNCDGQLDDAAAAVAWTVHEIARYGGDAGRVFISGHSSGGHLVAVLATNRHYLECHSLCPDAIRGVVTISGVFTVNFKVNFFGVGYVFEGVDRRAVSPSKHASRSMPPFLIVCAEDWYQYMGRQAHGFYHTLRRHGCAGELFRVPNEDHFGQLLHLDGDGSPLGPRILQFIATH